MGRKSLKEELRLFERYSELTVPYFKFIREMFDSEKKDDKKWATERIEKAFVKMIPQDMDVTSGGEPLPILAPMNVSTYNSNLEDKPAQETA